MPRSAIRARMGWYRSPGNMALDEVKKFFFWSWRPMAFRLKPGREIPALIQGPRHGHLPQQQATFHSTTSSKGRSQGLTWLVVTILVASVMFHFRRAARLTVERFGSTATLDRAGGPPLSRPDDLAIANETCRSPEHCVQQPVELISKMSRGLRVRPRR